MGVVDAKGVPRLRKRVGTRVVIAADQMDLRDAVEDRAGGLVIEQGCPHGQRGIERLGRARQLSEPDRNLSQRAEGDGQAVARRILLMQRHGAFGQRQRVLVAMADHRDVGLIAARDRHHVVGLHGLREPFGLTHGHQRLVVPPLLGQAAARQRVHERQVALVADRVQGRRGFAEVIGHGGPVADQLVAARELEVSEPDGAQVVRELRVLEGLEVQRDGTRLVAPGRGHPSMESPEVGQRRRRDRRFTERVGGPAQAGAGLGQVVLQQPRLGQQHTKGQLVLAGEGART